MLVVLASGSADSQTGIIEVWRNAVGASSFHQVEILEAGADASNEVFVDSALGRWREDFYWGRDEDEGAVSVDSFVAGGTVA